MNGRDTLFKTNTEKSVSDEQALLRKSTEELQDKHNAVVKLLWSTEQDLIRKKSLLNNGNTSKNSEDEKIEKEILVLEALIKSLKNCLNENNSSELIEQNQKKLKELEMENKSSSLSP